MALIACALLLVASRECLFAVGFVFYLCKFELRFFCLDGLCYLVVFWILVWLWFMPVCWFVSCLQCYVVICKWFGLFCGFYVWFTSFCGLLWWCRFIVVGWLLALTDLFVGYVICLVVLMFYFRDCLLCCLWLLISMSCVWVSRCCLLYSSCYRCCYFDVVVCLLTWCFAVMIAFCCFSLC